MGATFEEKSYERTAIATVPVTVEYEMTKYGLTLEPVLRHIQDWGKKHRARVMRGETISN